MSISRPRPFVAWIACIAVLTAALAPLLGHAVATVRGLPVVVAELCSAGQGGRLVIWAPLAADADPAQPADGRSPRGGAGKAHCPACLGSPDPAGLPPTAAPAFLLVAAAYRLPAALLPVPAAPSAWTPANPRAPPPHA
ncbi:MAG: DUF2946 domain-containing protein [Burkholderiaceae bacterium]|nr:DUF2946 domain-containing protein [Burkholderiaceae bacterium]